MICYTNRSHVNSRMNPAGIYFIKVCFGALIDPGKQIFLI